MTLKATLLLTALLTAARLAEGVTCQSDKDAGSYSNCKKGKCAVELIKANTATYPQIWKDIAEATSDDTDEPANGWCNGGSVDKAGCPSACSHAVLVACCTECADGFRLVETGTHSGASCAACTAASKCKKCQANAAQCQECATGYAKKKDTDTVCHACATGYKLQPVDFAGNACLPDGSAASGDPHVTNIRGEAFDVLREGTMEVVVLPRGASPTSPIHHLTVQAKIARASKKLCEATFIERVSAFGSWLGGERELVIDAGTVHDMTPLRLKLGSDKGWTDWDKVDNILNAENTQIPKTTITSSRDEGKHPTIRVAFDIGDEDISILISLFQHKHFSFLNLDVNGLENYEAEVGGILGLDSHSLATAPDVECEHKFERKHSEEGLEIVASKMTASLGVARS